MHSYHSKTDCNITGNAQIGQKRSDVTSLMDTHTLPVKIGPVLCWGRICKPIFLSLCLVSLSSTCHSPSNKRRDLKKSLATGSLWGTRTKELRRGGAKQESGESSEFVLFSGLSHLGEKGNIVVVVVVGFSIVDQLMTRSVGSFYMHDDRKWKFYVWLGLTDWQESVA